jgi:hypothetical protein
MSTTTPLIRYPVSLPAPSVRFLIQAWWTCYSAGPHTWRNRSDALLATGNALSVVSPSIREGLDLETFPVPGWTGVVPTWMGIPCRIARATVWLPILDPLGSYRSLPILVLLPQEDLPDAPPFIHLGAQFLLEHHVQVVLDEGERGDRLVIPEPGT